MQELTNEIKGLEDTVEDQKDTIKNLKGERAEGLAKIVELKA
jgi:hypothetical protein